MRLQQQFQDAINAQEQEMNINANWRQQIEQAQERNLLNLEARQDQLLENQEAKLFQIILDKEQVIKITSIIAILGVINVPIIKFSVDWWNTLHQPASINILSKSSIHISMLYPLMIMTAAFALFSLLIFLMKYNTELIKIKNKGLDRL